jgi:hypothetical protein
MNQMITIKTYRIAETNLFNVKEIFADLRKKAEKVPGAIAPRYTLTGYQDLGGVNVYNVTVSAPEPVIGDWILQAAIYSQPEAARVDRCAPGLTTRDDQQYLSGVNIGCDFCHTANQQNTTFFLLNVLTQEWKQLGRTCLNGYFEDGYEEIDATVAGFEWMLDLHNELSNLEYDSVLKRHSVIEVLRVTSNIIRRFGYVEPSAGLSTLEQVNSILRERVEDAPSVAGFNSTLSQNDHLTSATVLDWLRSDEAQPARTDYEYVLRSIAALDTVDDGDVGFLVSAQRMYFTHLELERKAAMKAEYNAELVGSKHTGTVGEMTNFADLKVLFYRECPSEEWGTSHLYKFLTPDGNVLVTFTRNEEFVNTVKVGDTVHIRSKVKGHSYYEEIAQTDLSHVKLISAHYAKTGKQTASDKKTRAPKGQKAGTQTHLGLPDNSAALARYEDLSAIPIDDSVGF